MGGCANYERRMGCRNSAVGLCPQAGCEYPYSLSESYFFLKRHNKFFGDTPIEKTGLKIDWFLQTLSVRDCGFDPEKKLLGGYHY